MYSIRLRTMFQRCTIVKKKRASSKIDSEKIRKASQLLEAGALSDDEFLEFIAKMKSQKIVASKRHTLSDDSDSDDENASTAQTVPSTSHVDKRRRTHSTELCVMCYAKDRSVVFLPCTHAIVCSDCCSQKLKTDDTKCNKCQAHITSHLIFRK